MTGPENPEGAGAAGDKPFQFTDRRRIDPDTGIRRPQPARGNPGGPVGGTSPFPGAPGSAGNPADPNAAGQPLSVSHPDIEAAQQEAADRLADLQRVTAEYANYRKRVDRDREQVVLAAKAAVLTEMLPVLDDLDRADAHGDLTGAFKAVADKLSGVLTRLGLQPVGTKGEVFDPALHEAVQFATSPEVSEPTVTEVLRHGYLISERLVRPAVVVVTGPDHESGSADRSSSDQGSTDQGTADQGTADQSTAAQTGAADGAGQNGAGHGAASQGAAGATGAAATEAAATETPSTNSAAADALAGDPNGPRADSVTDTGRGAGEAAASRSGEPPAGQTPQQY